MYAMRINAAIVLLFGALCSTAANARQDKAGKTVWDAVYSEAQAKRGETAYATVLRQVPRSRSHGRGCGAAADGCRVHVRME